MTSSSGTSESVVGDIMSRPVVILVPGPALYLFRTTGIYFLYELVKTFDLVVLITSDYVGDGVVQAVLALPGVVEVVPLPEEGLGIVQRQAALLRLGEDLARRFRPILILQHNTLYIHNWYINHVIHRHVPNCLRLAYPPGMLVPIVNDLELLANAQIEIMRRSAGCTRLKATLDFFVAARRRLWVEHFMVPRLVVGEFYVPSVDYETGMIATQAGWEDCDGWLVFFDHDKALAESDFPGGPPVHVVLHPLEVVGTEMHQWLGMPTGEALIAVMPSHGFLPDKVARAGGDMSVIDKVAETWIAALFTIQSHFPECRMVWKAHPSGFADPLFVRLAERVLTALPWVENRPANSSGQDLAMRAKVVVSDVSTILWWAGLLPSKLAISLDLFGYSGGNALRDAQQVRTVSTIAMLEEMLSQSRDTAGDPDGCAPGRPTATVFILSLLASRPAMVSP